ncbi:mitochondrial carrier [Armillaria borealis]|uniref:Mitochondrial carrier n=1 Tax=Armillaria borealis TaxID=47425 RepID=A0AA39MN59_9AGAR|nr:mitochondrial carrier [Armillaria borealis]
MSDVIAKSPQPDPETQPLLDSPQVAYDTTEPSAEIVKQERSWKHILFYLLTTLLGVGILAIFIKGFIDADDVTFDFKKALKAALGGGLSGAAAMVLQVLTLMHFGSLFAPVMNYQYRFGSTTSEAILTLYNDGGWTRYYQGLSAALIQGPVSRFGDTAANAGILALLSSNTYMKTLPPHIQTIFVSLAAAAFRIILTPIDTVKQYGIGSLWYGALATAAATFVGNYPWFSTYNYLDQTLPPPTTFVEKLLRQAFIGFCAAVVSDTISNSLRVLKTYRQVNETRIGYLDAARAVIAVDGVKGLFGRGLKTRIIANGLQSIMFSILWKLFLDLWNRKTEG